MRRIYQLAAPNDCFIKYRTAEIDSFALKPKSGAFNVSLMRGALNTKASRARPLTVQIAETRAKKRPFVNKTKLNSVQNAAI